MIKAILHVNNLSVNVLYYEFEFKKITDEKWQPYPGARFEGLVVKVEGSENNMWWEHAIADHMPISKVTLELQPAVLGQQKTIYHHFYDCHITSYKSKFSSESKQPYYELFLITCQGFESTASVAVYQTKLRKTFDRNVTPVVRETAPTSTRNEKKITNYYLTNTDGEAIEGYKKGDIIVVNIETLNRIGDSVTIDLNNAQYDFEYNGSILPNDTLKNIVIGSDLEQIELKVVAQKQHTS
jgi:hypothetical protein